MGERADKYVEILSYVAKFGQLPTEHIKVFAFPGKAGDPQRRYLDNMVAHGLLARLDERWSGTNAGNSMWVYQLGREGHKQAGRRGRYHLAQAINRHQKAIADVHLYIAQAQLDGKLRVLRYATEPDCHYDDTMTFIEPDLFEEVGVPSTGLRKAVWIEVDNGTESRTFFMKKLVDYAALFENRGAYLYEVYPTTLILCRTSERVSEIRGWIKAAGDLPKIFTVGLFNEVVDILTQ